MKYTLIACTALLLAVSTLISCKKGTGDNPNLAQLQHKWNIVSLNGEVFRYVGKSGDYFDFRSDSKLYQSWDGRNDTLSYTLSGSTVRLNQITNGVQQNPSFNLYIKKLTSSSLILYNNDNPSVGILDSLAR
jgi:hypothetical protein